MAQGLCPTHMRRFLLIPAVLLVLLVLSLRLSTGGGGRAAQFTFINRGEVNTLDTNRMSWLQDIRIAYALWEGLYTLQSDHGTAAGLKTVPGAAERIDLSDDKTTYTFHLRPQARWSNGDPVVAGDFIFAWKRMLQEPADYTYLLFYLHGAKQYSEAFEAWASARQQQLAMPAPDFKQVGVTACDALTLRVQLDYPVTFFPDLCAFPPFFPLHEPSMRPFAEAEDSGHTNYKSAFMRPPNLVSNGPFRLAEWQFHRKMRLVANQYYWDRGQVKSQVIDQLSSEDPQTSFLAYETGGADWLAEVTGDTAFGLAQRGRKDLHVFGAFGTYFYTFNCNAMLPDGSPNPFADVRVRQAFAMALDKRFIVNQITRMGERTTTQYVPPGVLAGYQSPAGLAFDPKAARRLLAEAGYPDGAGFPHFSLLFNNEGQHAKIAEYAIKQWADNLQLGDRGTLAGVEINTFRQYLHNKNYTMARANWFGDYYDVSTFTDKYRSYSDNNDSDWKNPEYDHLCESAEREGDADKRLAMLSRAEAILLKECPILPVYNHVNAYLFRANVHGVSLNPRNMALLKEVWRE